MTIRSAEKTAANPLGYVGVCEVCSKGVNLFGAHVVYLEDDGSTRSPRYWCGKECFGRDPMAHLDHELVPLGRNLDVLGLELAWERKWVARETSS
jgi:hypothetical protein